ncbi:hypothetical protein [Kingella potus]|uniref:hypothetical protein n=1 Tax=Kingella potus TaxID=265175 RepID=UPI001FD02BF2|nr:hypothetical protein [Kingella potus]UOP01663.1 hypothetical protein LVJ84_05835 [Kingella potus]
MGTVCRQTAQRPSENGLGFFRRPLLLCRCLPRANTQRPSENTVPYRGQCSDGPHAV